MIAEAFKQHGGNHLKTAAELGISRTPSQAEGDTCSEHDQVWRH
jgi:hypothetical protein